MLRSLMTVAVLSRSVASARSTGFKAGTEAVFGVFVMAVVGCSRGFGCRSGVVVRAGAGDGFFFRGVRGWVLR